MERRLIITKLGQRILTTMVENGNIVEFHIAEEQANKQGIEVGDIYVGKVKNIVANINAAFVEIAKGVECYYSLEEGITPMFTHKIGKKALCIGDELVVQISKEAIKTKVPTVSGKINLTGKYAVLTYEDTRVGVSKKIAKEEHLRLREIAEQYQSEQYGIILRTNAKDAPEELLHQELEALVADYHKMRQIAPTRTCFSCLKQTEKPYIVELKDVNQEGLTEIVVEDVEIYEEIREYLQRCQPEDLPKLRHYQDKLLPLHKLYGIEKCMEDARKERVWMKSGAYLVIQPTEALTVIDVNTGKCISKKKDEKGSFNINLEAAKEVARQIRLRNLSGIIIIDFINLSTKELREELLNIFERELKKDRVVTTLVGMTKLQLVEVTRKKVRRPLHEAF